MICIVHKNISNILRKYLDDLSCDDSFSSSVKCFIARELDENFDLEYLCSKFHMSRSNFSKKLNKEGNNYGKLLTEVRIDLGKILLQYSTLSISDISFLLGYKSDISFGRKFNKVVGVKAREYRESACIQENYVKVVNVNIESIKNIYSSLYLSECILSQAKIEAKKLMMAGHMSFENLAIALFLKINELKKAFKISNTSYRDIILCSKFEMAKLYLIYTSYSICEIACNIGYETESSFSKEFKKFFGITPSRYRYIY